MPVVRKSGQRPMLVVEGALGYWLAQGWAVDAPASVPHRDLSSRKVRVVATAPAVTLSAADAATAITGSVLKQPLGSQGAPTTIAADPNFLWLGTPSMAYQGNPNQAFVAAPVLTGSASSARYAPSAVFDGVYDACEIVFRSLATSRDFRLRVDGEFVTEYSTRYTGLTVGGVYRLLVQFTGPAAHRRLQIDLDGSSFGGVAVAPTHAIWRASMLPEPTTVLLGDSITAGANTGAGIGGYSRMDSALQTAAYMCGWNDVRNVAIAGTGYSNAGADAAFTSRLADLEVPGGRFVVFGGFNDGASLNTSLSASVDTVFSKIVAQQPAEVFILGNHAPLTSYYGNTSYMGVHELLRAKAAAYGFVFIDTYGLRPIVGTGNSTTPTGVGNSDAFTNVDNVHPTRAGAQHLGRVYAKAIADSYLAA